MAHKQPTRGVNPARTLQKFVVSTFVVCSFVAYAVHERIANPDGVVGPNGSNASAAEPLTDSTPAAPSTPELALGAPPTAAPARPAATVPPRAAAQTAPTAAAKPRGLYKDGTYTGSEVDAMWGWVRVKAVIQNGKISDVQFLEYPNDRRTSVRINTTVIPYLRSEAIQAQNANVDLISGATLTSEAFIESLQVALNTAKGPS